MEFSLEQIPLDQTTGNPNKSELYMVDGNHLNCTVHEIDCELNLLNQKHYPEYFISVKNISCSTGVKIILEYLLRNRFIFKALHQPL
jgi:hypothetical protein